MNLRENKPKLSIKNCKTGIDDKMSKIDVDTKDIIAGLIGGVAAGLVVVMADDLTHIIFKNEFSPLAPIFKVITAFVFLIIVLVFILHE